jgi:hypothetical protein
VAFLRVLRKGALEAVAGALESLGGLPSPLLLFVFLSALFPKSSLLLALLSYAFVFALVLAFAVALPHASLLATQAGTGVSQPREEH